MRLSPEIRCARSGFRGRTRSDGPTEIPKDLTDWAEAPVPILVVEVISEFTRRREHVQKRTFYLDAAIAEYWIIDPDERSVLIVRANQDDALTTERLQWSPVGSREPLSIQLSEIFGD